jgi:hypothetical protein
MPLQATSGAASYDAFGGGVPVVPNYIEEVFATHLYTGNDSSGTTTQTITNNIDLSTKGGLVWFKNRSRAAQTNVLVDTIRGKNQWLESNTTAASQTADNNTLVSSFNTTGFTVQGSWVGNINNSGDTEVSWTFRKQPKFFDVVTYTGDGASPRTIAHSLGSTPGCIIIKRLDASGDWKVHHRSIASITQWLRLERDLGLSTNSQAFTSFPDANSFYVGNNNDVNASGGTFVAYLFAHNAGGFGLTGTDNVITCGSYTTDGDGNGSVTLGYEPQWLLAKNTTGAGNWFLFDNARGWPAPNASGVSVARVLYSNLSDAEGAGSNWLGINSTGFVDNGTGIGGGNSTIIYIAIRRGPMKVPTSGTSVFTPVARSGTSSATTVTAGFPIDLSVIKQRTSTESWNWSDRLRGASAGYLVSNGTFAEQSNTDRVTGFDSNTALSIGNDSQVNGSGATYGNLFFRRAPSFFDEVCYTGNGAFSRSITHNLGVKPNLVIVKCRSNSSTNWAVGVGESDAYLYLNSSAASPQLSGGYVDNANSTATTFYVDGSSLDNVNTTSRTYVAYLFATCAGVSKVGSYTGTGTTLQIDCGFTGGARFILIKRTDDVGNWFVWDTARGIVAGNDPYIRFNLSTAEVTGTDYVDTYSAGFEISSTAPAEINASGGTFIFLAIA